MMMNYWYGGFGWIWMVIGLIIIGAVIVGSVFLGIWIVTRMRNSDSIQKANNVLAPIEIAKERYTRGEITRDEFQKLLVDFGTR